MKKTLSIILSLVLLFGLIPAIGGIVASAETIKSYVQNDIIKFGWYPQTEVTNPSVVSALNAKVEDSDWVSYGYYEGKEEHGTMAPSDFMHYCDVMYEGVGYRGVYITHYRPSLTTEPAGWESTVMLKAPYRENRTYWFRWEPIWWRVLDPAEGFVLCEFIIDSQAYSNTVYSQGLTQYSDMAHTAYANNYEKSSIRAWLNRDFYESAFSQAQQSLIAVSHLNNDDYGSWGGTGPQFDSAATDDKIFLLSYFESKNVKYGFSLDAPANKTREALFTDYAVSQGLWVPEKQTSVKKATWYLRTAGSSYANRVCLVDEEGRTNDFGDVIQTSTGVRPAMRLNPNGEILLGDVKDLNVFQCHHRLEPVRRAPETCTQDGSKIPHYVCTICGERFSDPDGKTPLRDDSWRIPAAGHKPETIPGRAATCTETGLTDGEKCSVCRQMIKAQEIIPAVGHTPEIVPGRAATCTEDGLTDGEVCAVCGEVLNAQIVIPALGHSPDIVRSEAASCTKPGWTAGEICAVCGKTLKAQEVIPATGHRDDDGDGKCDVCGETLDAPVTQGLRGDANLDGKVLANDARLVLRASAKLETLEGQAFANCDLNGDGRLLAGEARKILRYSAKLETSI